MILSLDAENLCNYLAAQFNNFFPDGENITPAQLKTIVNSSLQRTEFCFKHIKSKYYKMFNHLNTDHYCTFLYFISNEAHKNNKINIAQKAFYLNKIMHGLDVFCSINLPDIFQFIHPVGTVIGKGEYKNYTVFYQGCTIGSKTDGIYPKFNEKTIFYSNSSVIGNCNIGTNVVFGANSSIVDACVEDNTVVLGNFPSNKFKNNDDKIVNYYFR